MSGADRDEEVSAPSQNKKGWRFWGKKNATIFQLHSYQVS